MHRDSRDKPPRIVVRVRRGVREDIPIIYAMVMQDAIIVDEAFGPTLTVEDLIRDTGLDPENPRDPIIIPFVAEEYDETDSTVPPTFIGYGMVTPPVPSKFGRTMTLIQMNLVDLDRGRGVGQLILTETARYGREIGVKRFIFYNFRANTAIQFYIRLGATNYTEVFALEAFFGRLPCHFLPL